VTSHRRRNIAGPLTRARSSWSDDRPAAAGASDQLHDSRYFVTYRDGASWKSATGVGHALPAVCRPPHLEGTTKWPIAKPSMPISARLLTKPGKPLRKTTGFPSPDCSRPSACSSSTRSRPSRMQQRYDRTGSSRDARSMPSVVVEVPADQPSPVPGSLTHLPVPTVRGAGATRSPFARGCPFAPANGRDERARAVGLHAPVGPARRSTYDCPRRATRPSPAPGVGRCPAGGRPPR
jgi:hypothetical protein